MSQDEIIAAYEKVTGALDRLEVMNRRLGAIGSAKRVMTPDENEN